MLEIKENDPFKNTIIIFSNNKNLESKDGLSQIRKQEENTHSKKSMGNI